MSDAPDSRPVHSEPADDPADEWSVPDCPRCGRPVWVVTVTGPGVGTASPCGCPVVPGSLERENGTESKR
ncbi:hypothetical protein DVR14_10200 [Natrinema thermotolerans]|nr:hypothetical protein [Natrinema thermotolerans]QCC58983.1 hypothetical protein DVR14_10200 [Natrinema thermotolerans]